ncbi:hypothetical protein JCM8097_006657 [Rhodosporidiobolus ruineniae]
MGFLTNGGTLSWEETQQAADRVRQLGVEQLLAIYHREKDRKGDKLTWGDEVECMLISYDHSSKNARVSLRQDEVLAALAADLDERKTKGEKMPADGAVFLPEGGRFMIESTPGGPYGAELEDLLVVEENMRFRREIIRSHLRQHEVPVTLTCFPRLGAPGIFTDPHYEPEGDSLASDFLPSELLARHARYSALDDNVNSRRGAKPTINIPIYFDEETPRPFIDPSIPQPASHPELDDSSARNGQALPDHIYMDAQVFGFSCCCLQITLQAPDLEGALRMYDSFVPLAPIMVPRPHRRFSRPPGLLSDYDCRWDLIAASIDDRTEEERGLKPLENDRFVIPKSRYDSVDCYISSDPSNRPEYNDLSLPVDDAVRDRLVERGLSPALATHFGHLFIRDPVVVFAETMQQEDDDSTDHFENIQSTNWQTVRFKPPPPGSPIGWRVEFRSMEVQLTDFENAAFAVFIVLLTRAVMSLGLNFYLPISKVDGNMHRAHRRDAVNTQKFFFRKNLFAPTSSAPPAGPVEDEYAEYTMDEIVNGKMGEEDFPGLVGVVRRYLEGEEREGRLSEEVQKTTERYLELISRRADGSLITTATFIRNFIRAHPSYKFDSVVSQEINYDLVRAVDEIERGERAAPELLPERWRKGYEGDTTT